MTFLNNKYWNMYQGSFYFRVMQSRHFLLKHKKYQRSKNATIENYITWIANYLQIGIALKTNCMQIKTVYRNPSSEKELYFDMYPSVDDLRKCNSIFQVFASFTFPSLYFKTDSKFLYATVVLRQWWIIITKKKMPLLWSDNWHSLRMKGLAAW